MRELHDSALTAPDRGLPQCRPAAINDHPDQLGRLLSGDVPEAEQAKLAAHLETCRDCRRTLDALAARSGLWKDLALLRDHEREAPTRGLSTDLEEVSPGTTRRCRWAFWNPPDEPGQLGQAGSLRHPAGDRPGRDGRGLPGPDRALDRLVAIKVLAPGMAATGAARRRFAREAKAAAAVVHEHVVTIHAVDITPQGIPYLVMQYVAGKSVQDLIDQGRPPELREILRIGMQAARALAAAHAQGLIHRDIKPANILLENGVERVKITDFGLARAVDDATMTQSGVVAGTPQYMSPEQARGDAIDHRTDLFSLGSVLYALCTGHAPFRGSSSMATLETGLRARPGADRLAEPRDSRLAREDHRPGFTPRIPADRYATAAEVAELLGRCLAHVQQPASVPLPAELFTRPKRRSFAAWGTAFSLHAPGRLALILTNVRAAVFHVGQLRRHSPSAQDARGRAGRRDGRSGHRNQARRQRELVVTGAGVKELRLAVGPHNVQALKDGKVLREELVTISRGGRSVLAIRREPDDQPLATDRSDRPDSPTVAQFVLTLSSPQVEIEEGRLVVIRVQGPAAKVVDLTPEGISWSVDDLYVMFNEVESMSNSDVAMKK